MIETANEYFDLLIFESEDGYLTEIFYDCKALLITKFKKHKMQTRIGQQKKLRFVSPTIILRNIGFLR